MSLCIEGHLNEYFVKYKFQCFVDYNGAFARIRAESSAFFDLLIR